MAAVTGIAPSVLLEESSAMIATLYEIMVEMMKEPS